MTLFLDRLLIINIIIVINIIGKFGHEDTEISKVQNDIKQVILRMEIVEADVEEVQANIKSVKDDADAAFQKVKAPDDLGRKYWTNKELILRTELQSLRLKG